MLQANGLECVRGERRLFQGLDLAVEPGQCLYVAGVNGAGKTSLLRILAGLLAPVAGTVSWKGRAIGSCREEYGADLAFVGHLNGIKDDLTALENLSFEAALRGGDAGEDAALAALARLRMDAYADVPVRQLSQGQRRRVALARLCAARRVPLWILDEPFNALDADSVEGLHDLVRAHLAQGGMVVLTAHQQIDLPAGARRLVLESAGAAS